jgi:hypothetical protein
MQTGVFRKSFEYYFIFEVLTAMAMKRTTFWYVVPCCLVKCIDVSEECTIFVFRSKE